MKPIIKFLGIASLFVSASIFVDAIKNSANAEITANPNDAGTIINQDGDTLNIEGGTRKDKNLFHSFEKFGLEEGQTANFKSNPEIENILGRVTGGDASVINGTIEVTGSNANLYLMNLAGIIFGKDASLDVPGSFHATTASGIGFEDNWFKAFDKNDYASLVGNPNAFAFTQAGTILNSGNLEVKPGQNLTLLGGTVINTGTLEAIGGNVTVAAVTKDNLIRISQQDNLLSLGLPLPVETKAIFNNQPFTPLSLPKLLTGGNLSDATGVEVENGVVKLNRSDVKIPNDAGTTVVSTPSGSDRIVGKTINIQGKNVEILSANIDGDRDFNNNFRFSNSDYYTVNTTDNIKIQNSDLSLVKNINLNSQNGSIVIKESELSANEDINLNSQTDSILIEAIELSARGDINFISNNRVKIAEIEKDSASPSFTNENINIQAEGNITIKGDKGIEIQALEAGTVTEEQTFGSPQSILASGGDFSLISENNIIANARIASGGNFSTKAANFSQPGLNLNGIISSNGDVNFGDYTGSSLKVEAKGNIRGGNITINKIGSVAQTGDPDIKLLNTGPSLVLRAGVSELANIPQSANVGGTSFKSTTNPSSPGNIQVGNIDTAAGNRGGSVTMSASGNINTGHIETAGNGNVTTTRYLRGFLDLQAAGNIQVKTINTSKSGIAGDVKIFAGGLFQATESFPTPNEPTNLNQYNVIDGNFNQQVFAQIPTSIYVFGLGQRNVDIQHGGSKLIVGPKFTDANGNLILKDNNANSQPFSVDTSGNVRDTNNQVVDIEEVVFGNPLNKENIDASNSFTVGAIISKISNGGIVASYRDSSLESSEPQTFSIGGAFDEAGEIKITFQPRNNQLISEQESIPEQQSTLQASDVQRQLTQKEQDDICTRKKTTTVVNIKKTNGRVKAINNDPCKATNNNDNNILKVIPDTRFEDNSALPNIRVR
ncbi:MAG: filamentous hemagglutinin N-terminal domain-containing protein [Cyanobacteria bacterium J06573_2]